MPANEAAVDPTQGSTNMNSSNFHTVADKVEELLHSRLAGEDEEHAVLTEAEIDLIGTYKTCTKNRSPQYFAKKMAQQQSKSTVLTKSRRDEIVAGKKESVKSLGDQHDFFLSVVERTVKDFEEVEGYNRYQRLTVDPTYHTQTAANHFEDWFSALPDKALEEESRDLTTERELVLEEMRAKREIAKRDGREAQRRTGGQTSSGVFGFSFKSFLRCLGGGSGA